LQTMLFFTIVSYPKSQVHPVAYSQVTAPSYTTPYLHIDLNSKDLFHVSKIFPHES